MSREYDRLLGLIGQCRQVGAGAAGIVYKADREDSYLAARIENGIPVDIQRFSTQELAAQHIGVKPTH